MTFLKEKDRTTLTKYFDDNLKNPVSLILFTQGESSIEGTLAHKCSLCQETEDLLTEVAELDERINVKILDFIENEDLAKEYGVERLPAIIFKNDKNHKIRLFGIPSGYEFSTLTKDIALISKNQTELKPETKERLQEINSPMHLQVFVTPTCPYCPRAVIMAHQFAMENSKITADMIEASEFVELATKYSVMGVPKIVINDEAYFEGALPETEYLLAVLKTAGKQISVEEEQKIARYYKPLVLPE